MLIEILAQAADAVNPVPSWVTDLGAAGALIVVVYLFLGRLGKQDDEARKHFETQSAGFTRAIENISSEFGRHTEAGQEIQRRSIEAMTRVIDAISRIEMWATSKGMT